KILIEEWKSDGYLNKKNEEERLNQAKKLIKNYYENECNPPKKPLALEYPFNFNLKNGVSVFGKMDRIDSKGKGLPAGRQGIEIIDYKTGEDNPKASSAHELQLAIYALAATRVKDQILNKTADSIKLTLHFLEKNTKKSMNFKKEDLDKLEKESIDKIKEIEESDFKCSGLGRRVATRPFGREESPDRSKDRIGRQFPTSSLR
ncbi:MAG: PD-(D/E)XK nuclease family protein, partial [Candidatus Levybacteria bacterium]|nr:PD-(D/E)XK nuclease family protein [Candidatus Levybacteria bacterium]